MWQLNMFGLRFGCPHQQTLSKIAISLNEKTDKRKHYVMLIGDRLNIQLGYMESQQG